MNGRKILMIEWGKLRFIDSLSYMPMELAALPKAFGLTETKGFYPHKLKSTDERGNDGRYPDPEAYDPGRMSPEKREEFYTWRGVQAVGREAFKSGLHVLDDVVENRASFRDSLKSRATESGKNLTRKATAHLTDMMAGSGYKGLMLRRGVQLKRSSRPRRKLTRAKKTLKRQKQTRPKQLKRLIKKRTRKVTKLKSRRKVSKRKKSTRKNRIDDIFG
ncbi:hypothetical protein QAD02_020564 [Eretmocerus hayati]|uniref:Uncharacterized protein n=1 Tax=Eretmocerus hayati TaxID=131215 RepID=A0ACC2PMR5_9HYME|nr:hypothetical protein QAD02_020564 [Eretmocerus hayati]